MISSNLPLFSALLVAASDPAAAQRLLDGATDALSHQDYVRAEKLLDQAHDAVSEPGDADKYRDLRDDIRAARRDLADKLSAEKDDHEPLCRLRAAIVRDYEDLKADLGLQWDSLDDRGLHGIQGRLAEVDGKLNARRVSMKPWQCSPPQPAPALVQKIPADPPAQPEPQPSAPAPATSASQSKFLASAEAERRAHRLELAGTTLLTGSLLPLCFMTIKLVVYTRDYYGLKDLRMHWDPNDPNDVALRDGLFNEGKAALGWTITGGSVAAIMLGAGIGLLARARRTRGPSRLDLMSSAGTYGLVWRGRF